MPGETGSGDDGGSRVGFDDTQGTGAMPTPSGASDTRAERNVSRGSSAITRRRDIAKKLKSSDAKASESVLLALHGSYVDRYQKDQERTWSTATWLLAVAWSLFPAATAFGTSLNEQVVYVFGGVSSALVLLWSMVAWWYLAWASRSYDMVRALEIAMLGEVVEETIRPTLKDAHPGPLWMPETHAMRILRLLIAAGTVAAWYGMLRAVETGWFDFPPPLGG
jgi:hypothetical protein